MARFSMLAALVAAAISGVRCEDQIDGQAKLRQYLAIKELRLPVTVVRSDGEQKRPERYELVVPANGNLYESAVAFTQAHEITQASAPEMLVRELLRATLPAAQPVDAVHDAKNEAAAASDPQAAGQAAAAAAGQAGAADSADLGVASPAPEVALTVTDGNGHKSVLQLLPDESVESAARRWVLATGRASAADVDADLRVLVRGLRIAQGTDAGLPLTTRERATTASTQVTVGGEVRVVRMLEGESAEEAALGFLQRMGLPAEGNAQLLADELRRNVQRPPAPARSAGSDTGLLDGVVGLGAAAGSGVGATAEAAVPAVPVAPPAGVPVSEGVSLRVSFEEGDRPPATIVYRWGEDLGAAVSAFLDAHGITDPTARQAAHAKLSKGLQEVATAALKAQNVAVGAGAAQGQGEAGAAAAQQQQQQQPRDLTTRKTARIPLSVGSRDFTVTLQPNASVRAAARLLCEQEWAVLRPALAAALEAAVRGLPADAARTSELVSQETCRAITFDVMAGFLQAVAAAADAVVEQAAPAAAQQ